MKVVRIIARLNIGGPAYHVWTLSEGLREHGFETVLVAGQCGPGEKSFDGENALRPRNFRLISLGRMGRVVRLWGDLLSFWEIFRILRAERPEVVHTHTAKAGVLGRMAARLVGVPVVVHTFHGHVFDGYFPAWLTALILGVERLLAKMSTVIVTLSPALKRQLAQVYRVAPEERIRIIPLGTSIRRFLDTPRRAGALRRELGLAPDVFLVGSIGRLVPIKNFSLLLRALEALPRTIPWHLALAGEGECGPELERLAGDLGIREKVSFLGWRTDTERLLSDMDLFAISSLNEGTPLAIIEAFAAGCPVVATEVGGVADLFQPGERAVPGFRLMREGALVGTGDAGSLTRAIQFFAGDEEILRAAGSAARASSLDFSEEKLKERVAALYRELGCRA
ncbi:MAG: glycosyltransferase [Bdellovibrionales bacterium]|nr:glycosyltransferase [Bdellovibrionales bacterium]